ncbi:RHS repeat-associated core domain-containing protein [Catenulispora rubra]|uniref:RHS repeat-associated core domain-containing protein n=1 Tax=Catenulispora rubra TaxID=280293 RepID=UPI0018922FB1|nr:RHS repeat-associated core domain-containing protein [Catenulispora rubra]
MDVVIDPRGLAMSYEFSYSGSLLARWSGDLFPTASTTRSWGFGAFGQVASMLDENGNATSWQWASEGWLNAITRYRDGQTSTTTAYMHQTLGPNDQVLQPGDPRYGEVTQTIDADGHVVNMTYNANGSLVTQSTAVNKVAANAATSTYAYTCDNNTVPPAVVNDTTVAASTLQPCNLRASMTDPDGRVTTYGYDHLGRQTRVTTPAGQVSNSFYDAYGNMVKKVVVDGAGSMETDYTYDPDGHLLTQLDPSATNQITGVTHQMLTTDRYDSDGNLASSTRADQTPTTAGGDNFRRTIYSYDGMGNRTQTRTSPSPVITNTTATYDALGDMLTETDTNGTTFHYGYNQAGQPTYTELMNFVDDPSVPTAPRNVFLSFKYYDYAGRLQAVDDAMQHTVSYTYTNDDLKSTDTFQSYQETPGASAQDLVLHTYTYDLTGNQFTDTASGTSSSPKRVTKTGYDIANTRTSTTVDPGGLNRTTAYAYDPAGTLLATTLSDGTRTETTSNGYTPTGQLYQVSVHNDAAPDEVSTFQRDASGNVLASTDPRGSAAFGSTTPPSPAYTTTDGYDTLGRLVSVTEPPVQVENGSGAAPTTVSPQAVRGYDTFGEPTDVRDPNGAVTHTVYDGLGRKTEVDYPTAAQPDGSTSKPVEKWTYDSNGNVLTHVDRLGQTTTYKYDMRNRPLTVTQPSADGKAAAGVIKNVYDDANNLLSQIDPTGAQVLHTYDVAERLSTTVQVVRNGTSTPTQYTTSYTYDAFGEVLSVRTADTSVRMRYNNAGQLLFSQQSGRGTTSYQYDVAGRPTVVSDPLGRSAQYTYDLAGQVVQAGQYDATKTVQATQKYGYDQAGQLTSLTDGRGNVRSAAYNAAGQLTSITDPATVDNKGVTHPAAVTTTGYDADGNPTRTTDANGNAAYQTYDSLGEPITRVEPATAAQPNVADRTWTVSHNTAGSPIDSTAPGGVSTTETYDNLGRLTGQTGTGAETATAARSLGYDLDGQLTSMSSAALAPMSFGYDDRGLMTSASDTPPGGTSTVAYTASYDAEGRLTHRVDVTGATDYTYSGLADVGTETDMVSGATRAYTYDTAGQLQTEKDTTSGTAGPSTAYGYDALGRINTQTLSDPTNAQLGQLKYTWDPNGNLTSKTGSGTYATEGSHTYAYDAADRLTDDTTSSGGTTSGQEQYTWDPVGNRTSVTDLNAAGTATSTTTAIFDQRNRLQTLTAPDATTTYTWSPRGTLAGTSKTVTATGATTTTADKFDAFGQLINDGSTTYSYDALGRLQNNGNGSSGLNQYAQAGLEPASDGAWNYARAPGDTSAPLAATPTSGGSALSLQTNAHGDIIAGTNPKTGALAASRSHNAFGAVTTSTGTLPNVGYQGSYTSPATGRTYAESRWYDPTAGIFLSEDSAAPAAHNAVGTNLYAYAAANPTSAFDPSGHDCGWFSVVCNVGSDIGNAISTAAQNSANAIGQITAFVGAGVSRAAVAVAEEAAPALAAATGLAEVAEGAVVCAFGCVAALVVGSIIVLGVVGYGLYTFAVTDRGLTFDGLFDPVSGTTGSLATTTAPGAGTDPSVFVHPPSTTTPVTAPSAANQPAPPPPPPPPHITSGKTVTATKTWDTTSKWYDNQYLYTRVDHYSQVTTTVYTYWSDGRHYWQTTVSPVKDDWTITQQLLIDWSNPIQFATPTVTVADNRAPASGQGTAPVGTCGAGGNTLSCTAADFPTLPPGGLLDLGGATSQKSCLIILAGYQCTADGNLLNMGTGTTCSLAQTGGCGDNMCHSFAGGTRVLMADGNSEPIEDVKVGDTIENAAPGGALERHRVDAVHKTLTDKSFTALTISTAHGDETITSTQNHPYYDVTQGAFVNAAELRISDRLETGGNSDAAVAGIRDFSSSLVTYDLTIDGLHTYYVVAGDTPVLVHNDTCKKLPSTVNAKYAVLGRRGSPLQFYRGLNGFEVLSLRKWNIGRNDEWIAGIIAKGQPVLLASPISDDSLAGDPKGGYDESIFAREVNQLLAAGYEFSDEGTGSYQYLVPPSS